MKSCLGTFLIASTFLAVVGGSALIWYLSQTAEFSRKPIPTPSPTEVKVSH